MKRFLRLRAKNIGDDKSVAKGSARNFESIKKKRDDIFKDYEMVIVESVSVIKTYVRKDAENKYKTFLNQTKNKEK